MVCPYRHVADYTDLDETETIEFGQFAQVAMTVIRRVSGAHGFNLGMNQGHVAGAGIAAHLHQHVLPRWDGDTNFLPIIARTKTVPQLLVDTRRLLADGWESYLAERSQTTAPQKTKASQKGAAAKGTAAKAAAGKRAAAKAASAKGAAGKAAAGKTASTKAAAGKRAAAKAGSAKAAAGKRVAGKTAAGKTAARKKGVPGP